MNGDHIVMDALRQMLRCEHCRAETILPTPCSLDTLMREIKVFSAPHEDCHIRVRPGSTYVRTGKNGAALKRDEQGLWWSWTPDGPPARYTVVPVPRDEAVSSLQELFARWEASRDGDEVTSVKQARAALLTEGLPA